MKILQIISHYVPAYHYGGALHVAHALSRALIQQGHEVRVVTTNLESPRRTLPIAAGAAVQQDGVPVYYEPVQLSRYWGFSLSLARRTWQQAAWADICLFHFHYQFASLVGGWACRQLRKPFVIFSHGSLNRFGISRRSRWLKQLYLRLLEGRNFRRTLFVAYHSQEELESSLQPSRSLVVPNGIDPRSFSRLPEPGSFRRKFALPTRKTMLLYLGRIDAGKGLDLLIPAFARLVSVHPNLQLVLAGGDERGYTAAVRSMILYHGLQDSVTMTGLISGEDKLGALQDAELYVLPSRSEGLSIAMLEAMYMGLPVVVSDRVGLWKQVRARGCGAVFALGEDGLEQALHTVILDPQRAEMGRRGRVLVEAEYTWDTIGKQLVERIRERI